MPRYRLHYVDAERNLGNIQDIDVDEVIRADTWTELVKDGRTLLRIQNRDIESLVELSAED